MDDGEAALGDVPAVSSSIRAGAVLGPVPSSSTASPAENPTQRGAFPGHSLELGFITQPGCVPRGSPPALPGAVRLSASNLAKSEVAQTVHLCDPDLI